MLEVSMSSLESQVLWGNPLTNILGPSLKDSPLPSAIPKSLHMLVPAYVVCHPEAKLFFFMWYLD
jgi:hypothetical protein